MGRTLEQILAQEDPTVVKEARKMAAKILSDIRRAEQQELNKKQRRAEQQPSSQPVRN